MREEWKSVCLGAISNVIAGQSPKGSAYNDSGDGLPFYQGKKQFSEKYIGEPTSWTTHVTKEAFPGDILMSVRAPVGPVNFAVSHCCIGRGLAAIQAGSAVDEEFLFYALTWKQPDIKGNEGAVFSSINRKQIEGLEIPLPNVGEQRRIVAMLNEAFEGVETVVANTEKNLTNVREVFESYLDRMFREGGDDWYEAPIFEHVDFIDYRGKTPKKVSGGVRLITAKNVRMGSLRREPEEFIHPDDYDSWMTRGFPKRGDVLFTTEAPLGLVCQLDTDERVALAQRIITMQPDQNVISSEYLSYVLRCRLVQGRIHSNATGATAAGIKASLLKKILIPIAPLKKQKELVESISVIEAETLRLEMIYQQKLTALAELKQSLLQKAFSGELTAERAEAAVEEVTA